MIFDISTLYIWNSNPNDQSLTNQHLDYKTILSIYTEGVFK